MIERKENWRRLLAEEIDKRNKYKFAYGRHDCCIAATACVKAMTGVNLVREFVEYKNKNQAFEILKDNKGLKNMAIKVAKKYALEEVTPGYEQAGDIVLHEVDGQFALGIMYLTPTHFISPKHPEGWAFMGKDKALKVWRV